MINFGQVLVVVFLCVGFPGILSDSFAHWFDDQHAEIYDTPVKLTVQFYNGATSLPDSLTKSGALIRLGPSVLNTRKANYTNYIDGFGRVTKWSFGSGKDQILFQSALLKSKLWNNSAEGTEIPPHITSEKLNPSHFDIVELDNMDNTDVFLTSFPRRGM